MLSPEEFFFQLLKYSSQSFLCSFILNFVFLADCIWNSWEDWSACTKTCGGGTQMRNRRVATQETKGGSCDGESSEHQDCNSDACPIGMIIPMNQKYILR